MKDRTRVCVVAYKDNTDEGIEIYFDADRADLAILRLSAVITLTAPTERWSNIGENGEKILFEFESIDEVVDWILMYPDCEVLEDCRYDMTGREYIEKYKIEVENVEEA